MTRRLPLRVTPLPGEAIDSWVEAYARRYEVPRCEILRALGLSTLDTKWKVRLSAVEMNTAVTASGFGPELLASMTMDRFDGVCIAIREDTRRLRRSFPWGGYYRSRYCPRCLADSGGRWQLAWRLCWSFLCTKHLCLLEDVCPDCGGYQRTTSSRRCEVDGKGTCTANRKYSRCGTDLSTQRVHAMAPSHRSVAAQRTIYDILDRGYAGFGVYTNAPCDARDALTDISILASRVLAHTRCSGLSNARPLRVLDAYLGEGPPQAQPWLQAEYKSIKEPPRTAVLTAVAIGSALRILECRSVPLAARNMYWLVPERGHGHTPAGFTAGLRGSQVLSAVNILAYTPKLGPVRQLRYQPLRATPARQRRQEVDTDLLAAKVPTLFWPEWSVRLGSRRQRRPELLRQVLSCSALLGSSSLSIGRVVEMLDTTLNEWTLWSFLSELGAEPHWSSVTIAFARLADYLTSHAVPIDYTRRRQLDYRSLLKDDDWYGICDSLDIRRGGPHTPAMARIYLFSRISCLPAEVATPKELHGNYSFSYGVRNFPLRLTSALAAELDRQARKFLISNEIGEPVTWHPPLRLFDNLELPGASVDEIDIVELHETARRHPSSVTTIADMIDADVATVRHLLEKYPLPPDESAPTAFRTTPTAQLRSVLNPQRLQRLREVERKSGRAIAEDYGVSYPVLRRLATSYGISFAQELSGPPRNWLYKQYVVRRRLLPDLADELGVCAPTVAAWIKEAGLQQARPAYRIRAMSTEQAAAFLAPVLRREAGPRSLQNFVDAAAQPNLTSAAKDLGIDPTTLHLQVKRLGHDLGGPLLHKARHPQPMAPTPLGQRVISAFTLYRSGQGAGCSRK